MFFFLFHRFFGIFLHSNEIFLDNFLCLRAGPRSKISFFNLRPFPEGPKYFCLPNFGLIAQRHPNPNFSGVELGSLFTRCLSVHLCPPPGKTKPNSTQLNSTQLNPNLFWIQTSTESKPQPNPNLNLIETSTKSKLQPNPNLNQIQILTKSKPQPNLNLIQIQISTKSKPQPNPNLNQIQTSTKSKPQPNQNLNQT